MTLLSKRATTGVTALALLFAFTIGSSDRAEAKVRVKSVQTEAIWVAFDAEAKTVTAKVKKPGRGKHAKKLKKNKQATWAVKPEGSVLVRTTVAINGVKGELGDIPAGKTVNIYWRLDEEDPTILRARKIDVILSDEELDAKFGIE
ncbi:MAG: hypothetical protein JRE13_08025 [Deltaproteobacteria bacterium]|nr:hypothetical protein [Deltaproteobacteria bacterium]